MGVVAHACKRALGKLRQEHRWEMEANMGYIFEVRVRLNYTVRLTLKK